MTAKAIEDFIAKNGNAIFGITLKNGTKHIGTSLTKIKAAEPSDDNFWELKTHDKMGMAIDGNKIQSLKRI